MDSPAILPHAIVFPFPEVGHVNPLVMISIQLAAADCVVTILKIQQSEDMVRKCLASLGDSSLQCLGSRFRFLDVPRELLQPEDEEIKSGLHLGNIFLTSQRLGKRQGVLESLLRSLEPAVSVIVSDSFLFWTSELARRLSIPRVVFWASSATILGVCSRLARGERLQEETVDQLKSRIPDLSAEQIDSRSVLSFLCHPNISEFTDRQFQNLDGVVCILVNSFEELEGLPGKDELLPMPVRPVGPLVASSLSLEEMATHKSVIGANSLPEPDCLTWLDAHPPLSVIYIAFGSVHRLDTAQIEQLALGVEATKQPFVWAIREGAVHLPNGFIERTRGRGLIVGWSPQLAVLNHAAICCFLTHCGWNSTMESIFTGVPMLCSPTYGDQFLNCELIVKKWAIGMRLKKGEGGMVEADEIEGAMGALMQTEEGRGVRRRATAMKDKARKAWRTGGTSRSQMEAFLHQALPSNVLKTHLV